MEAAPGKLELIRAFVNTLDVEDGVEHLADPDALGDWYADHGLPAESVDADDLREARRLREALRAVLDAHHGAADPPPSAVATLNEIGGRARLVVRFGRGGDTALAPVDSPLAALLAVVHRASVEGTWSRLKVCPADTCRWAFYDRSKNRSRTWCSMEVCGNRTKARAYRERRARA